MSSFSDRPFHLGSHVGLRAFDVDSLGRLRAPQRGTVFKPGENLAECLTDPWDFNARMSLALSRSMERAMRSSSTITYEQGPSEKSDEPAPESKHVVGSLGCACGFYAYFDGKNDYAQPGRITAIIEGYGTYTIGSRGFRSSKARLVALVLPDGKSRRAPGWHRIWDRWSDWCEAGPSAFLTAMGAMGAMWATFGAIAASPWFAVLAVMAAGVSASAGLGFKHGLDRRYPDLHPHVECVANDSAAEVRANLVRRNYIDVPVYASEKAALAAHPLTAPKPLTPNDDDFWTTEAPR